MSDERLLAIQEQVKDLKASIELRDARLCRKLDHIDVRIVGDGTKDNVGLATRVEVLERSDERRTWRERSYVVGLIGLVCKAVWDLVPGGR